MVDCVACSRGLDDAPHRCRYCEEPVCNEHRLPENHGCVYQSLAGTPTEANEPPRRRRGGRSTNTDTATPLRKDTSDPTRATFGSDPPRSASKIDAPTSKSPAVETKDPDSDSQLAKPISNKSLTNYFPIFRNRPIKPKAVSAFLTGIKLFVIVLAIVGAIAIYQPGAFAALEATGVSVPDDASALANETGSGSAPAVAAAGSPNTTRVEHIVFDRINDIRSDRELSRLEKNPSLIRLAGTHSQNMAEHEYYSHESPSGASFESRVDMHAPVCSSVSENIHRAPLSSNAQVFGSDRVVNTHTADGLATYFVQGWMNSPEHRDNIIRTSAIHGAISVSESGGEVYATMTFGVCMA